MQVKVLKFMSEPMVKTAMDIRTVMVMEVQKLYSVVEKTKKKPAERRVYNSEEYRLSQ